MPKITVKEGRSGCPYCDTKATRRVIRYLIDPSTGKKDKFGGYFFGCNCLALTKNHKGQYNLTASKH